MKEFTSYPVITTSSFAKTVGFYEDMFELVPFYEAEGYIRLRHKDAEDVALTILDSTHQLVSGTLREKHASHLFSFVVKDFDKLYDTVYMEGLDIVKPPTEVGSGIRHFMFADPYNDVIINIMNQPADGHESVFKSGNVLDLDSKSSGTQTAASC